MVALLDASPWILAAVIFSLRVIDVSLGTMRTLSVVHGRVGVAMALGFVEVMVWVTAVAQVIANIRTQPALAVAYAGGFAAGNALGITLERRLALGTTAVRIVTASGQAVAAELRGQGWLLTELIGKGADGVETLIYATCPRRHLPDLIDRARRHDPQLFYVVERFAELSRLTPLPPTTGWRAVLKKK